MKVLKKNVNHFFKISTLFFLLVIGGCVKSNAEKKEFIKQDQTKTNEKIAKKYGELIIPDFVKKGEYEFDKFE